MNNIVNVSDEWCESLSKDEASLIIFELTEYRVRIRCAIENTGAQDDKVNKIYGSIIVILKNICDKIYEKVF